MMLSSVTTLDYWAYSGKELYLSITVGLEFLIHLAQSL